ncbi:GNAT family N-acetyltransferase [Vibrio cholerae]|nr:GNAT family N-acetyltransferase [Vibrio cholerae]EJL6444730.1 GNAT family N-acetyltransferase [Vibrio cholerae]EJL6527270.1 GNAT family N-acetyltransferase [Vibrio cholerae]EJU9031553.1 GNAT family N-acetyltransferase [Vibrio cholerae]EKG0026897.1 GNAT family N-acetyltransferase [Vibrio cholerae]
MEIRNANYTDVERIVEIHINAFEGFFLTFLGPNFLHLLYTGFIDKGLLRVAIVDSNIVGFSAGTDKPEVFFSNLRREKWLLFFFAATPSLMKKPSLVIKKLYSATFYKGDSVERLNNSFLLSSLAVDPCVEGKGIGKHLLKDLDELLSKKKECQIIYLITDKNENSSVLSFYSKCGFSIESEFKQSRQREMLRLVKSIKVV